MAQIQQDAGNFPQILIHVDATASHSLCDTRVGFGVVNDAHLRLRCPMCARKVCLTPLHQNHQPKLVIQSRMDLCFCFVHTKVTLPTAFCSRNRNYKWHNSLNFLLLTHRSGILCDCFQLEAV